MSEKNDLRVEDYNGHTGPDERIGMQIPLVDPEKAIVEKLGPPDGMHMHGANYVRVEPDDKKVNVAYILLIFFGALGVHRFYQGKIGTGLLWLFTIGLFGVGVLVDIFTLGGQITAVNKTKHHLDRRVAF